jgi:hypothetical protein
MAADLPAVSNSSAACDPWYWDRVSRPGFGTTPRASRGIVSRVSETASRSQNGATIGSARCARVIHGALMVHLRSGEEHFSCREVAASRAQSHEENGALVRGCVFISRKTDRAGHAPSHRLSLAVAQPERLPHGPPTGPAEVGYPLAAVCSLKQPRDVIVRLWRLCRGARRARTVGDHRARVQPLARVDWALTPAPIRAFSAAGRAAARPCLSHPA